MNTQLNSLYSKYLGSWVSISKDYSRVYAHSKDLENLLVELRAKKIKKGMIVKIPDQKYSAYVG